MEHSVIEFAANYFGQHGAFFEKPENELSVNGQMQIANALRPAVIWHDGRVRLRLLLVIGPSLEGKKNTRFWKEVQDLSDREEFAGMVHEWEGVFCWIIETSISEHGKATEEILFGLLGYAEEDLQRLDLLYQLICSGKNIAEIKESIETFEYPHGAA